MSDKRDDLNTQPSLTAILERVQKAEAGLYQAIERLAVRLEGHVREEVQAARRDLHDEIQAVRRELHEEVGSLREEMRVHFRKLETKFQLLIEDSMEVRANQRDLSKRMDQLEVKAS